MTFRRPSPLSRPVAVERTGWRDEAISRRHRQWGWDVPGLDLDWPVCEYDRGRAAGLIEYKKESAARVNLGHTSIMALADLAGVDRGPLPAFVVRYAADFSWWDVTPFTERGRAILQSYETVRLTEVEFVTLLYNLRGYDAPTDLADYLGRLV